MPKDTLYCYTYLWYESNGTILSKSDNIYPWENALKSGIFFLNATFGDFKALLFFLQSDPDLVTLSRSTLYPVAQLWLDPPPSGLERRLHIFLQDVMAISGRQRYSGGSGAISYATACPYHVIAFWSRAAQLPLVEGSGHVIDRVCAGTVPCDRESCSYRL